MAGSGKFKGQQELKNKAMLVVRNITKQEVTNVIFPNGITVGLDGVNFKNGFKVNGDSQFGGVVNAQEFRVNGGPLPTGDPSTPFLSVEVDSQTFFYGSKNVNESHTQTPRPITPSTIKTRIVQLNQTSSLSLASDVQIFDAGGQQLLTSSFNYVEISSGSTVTTFNITPISESYRTVYPITVRAQKEGLADQKKIFDEIQPSLERGPNIPVGQNRLWDASRASPASAGHLFFTNDGLISVSPPASGFVTQGAQMNGPKLGLGKIVSTAASLGHANLPSAFTTGSAAPQTMFYRSPTPSETNVILHNLRGRIYFKWANFDSSNFVEFQPVLYFTLHDSSSPAHTKFGLMKAFSSFKANSAGGQLDFDFGNDTTNSLEPTSLEPGTGLCFGIFIASVNGAPSSTSFASLSGSLYIDYAYDI